MSIGVVTDEREELVRTVRNFVSEKAQLAATRELLARGEPYDPQVWRLMSEQLGLPGVAVPEEHGGAGFGYADLGAVLEELGRVLLPSPLFATVALALPALLASEDGGAIDDYVPALAAGELTASLAWVEVDGSWDGGTATTATADGKLDGDKRYVVDGASADLLLVLAGSPEGPSLYAVEADAAGVETVAVPTFDQTRRLAGVSLRAAPGRRIGEAGAGNEIVAAACDRAAVLLAAEMVGGAQVCLDMSVEYAKQRQQFGRPIGSFQAIKHKCAEMLVDLEGARSAAYYGCWAADANPTELPIVASVAKATASEAFFHAAGENVQIHGGIGVTWEHDAHLYLKRAKSSSILLGDPQFHRRRLADRIGL
jgi:alkylation response protein AidB-like acyl-CoA dehydrogenase